MIMWLCWLFFVHFIADFLLQRREVAINKSSKLEYLAEHLIILFLLFYLGSLANLKFALFNTIIHGIIDWNIWRFYKRGKPLDFKYWEHSGFYATIGFDQFLHIVTITLLAGMFIK